MKKRILALFLAMTFVVSGIVAGNQEVFAEDTGAELSEDVEMDDILTGSPLVGYAASTRGVYLAAGYSAINDAGGGRIGCGGVTEAAMQCRVAIIAVVERKEGSSWVHITSWTNQKANAYSVSVSKYYPVASGYYYRVRCTHYANTDTSYSFTGGLLM